MSTLTLDDRDGRLSYSGGWFREGWNHDNTITLASTNDLTASVTFRFPVAARAVSYYGMRRSNGGLYDICFDCSGGGGQRFQIDAYDRSDNGQRPPTMLWRQEWSGNGFHTVTVSNKADSRGVYTNGQTGNSQLVIDRFVLEIAAPPPPPPPPTTTPRPAPPPQPTPTPTPTPNPPPNRPDPTTSTRNTPPNTPSNPDPTTARDTTTGSRSIAGSNTSSDTATDTSTTGSSASTSSPTSAPRTGTAAFGPGQGTGDGPAPTSIPLPHNAAGTNIDHSGNLIVDRESKVPLGAILGAVLGVLALIAAIILLCYWRRRRNRARSEPQLPDPDNDPTNPFNNAMLSGTISPDMSQMESGQPISSNSVDLTPGGDSGPHTGPSGKAGYIRNWSPDAIPYSSGSSPTPRPSESISGFTSFHASEVGQPQTPSNVSRMSFTSDSHLGQMGSTRTLSIYSQTSSQARLAPLRRVEVDAGPLPLRMSNADDDLESLPPDYGDVFGRNSRSVARGSAARSTMTVATTALTTFEEEVPEVPPLPAPLRRPPSPSPFGDEMAKS
ncbi:hypothetical protein CVT24_005285 [Panaeolus cyanescens]|uniref:Uncharacterized protein n=1 Tax=Panaeolus cyanescens TaxID=181874 RepID=A0A409Y991_9AGAR|nr:hypothetical protein CVT24_005285 [Panaeolus cyanescens]